MLNMVNALKFQNFIPYIFVQKIAFMQLLSGMANSVDPDQTAPEGFWNSSLMFNITVILKSSPRWLSWMRHPTGDQGVGGSTPAEVGNILLWRLIMKYFLRSFFPFR